MKKGDRVRISNNAGIASYGKVLDVRPPNQLPDLKDDLGVLAIQTMMEWYAVRVAIIQAGFVGYELLAFEVDGQWFDLHERELQIEVL